MYNTAVFSIIQNKVCYDVIFLYTIWLRQLWFERGVYSHVLSDVFIFIWSSYKPVVLQ